MTFMARTSAQVFQSPSGAEAVAVGHEPLRAPRPGNCTSPCRSSKVSVKPLKPPALRKARKPSSMRAASRRDCRCAPVLRSFGATV